MFIRTLIYLVFDNKISSLSEEAKYNFMKSFELPQNYSLETICHGMVEYQVLYIYNEHKQSETMPYRTSCLSITYTKT